MTLEQWETLLRNDCCIAHRCGYADWLEEQGRDTEAASWRWAIDNHKEPFDWSDWHKIVKDGMKIDNGCVWFAPYPNDCGYMTYTAKLPLERRKTLEFAFVSILFPLQNDPSTAAKKYNTPYDAHADLARVIEKMIREGQNP